MVYCSDTCREAWYKTIYESFKKYRAAERRRTA